MSMFIQYAPYKLREGNWDDLKESFADRCFDILNEYAPNFKRSVIARQVLSPLDLERTFGLTGGNIFQGAMTLNQLFFLRPVVGFADYRTPIRGLYSVRRGGASRRRRHRRGGLERGPDNPGEGLTRSDLQMRSCGASKLTNLPQAPATRQGVEMYGN